MVRPLAIRQPVIVQSRVGLRRGYHLPGAPILLTGPDDVSNHTKGQQGSDLAPVQRPSLRRRFHFSEHHLYMETEQICRSSTVIWTSTLVAGMVARALPQSTPTAALCICSQASTTGLTHLRCHRRPQTRFQVLNTRPCPVLATFPRPKTRRPLCHT